jgi:hypothetical protein
LVVIRENETSLIGAALELLNDNPNSNIVHQEFIKLTPDIRESWFKPLPQNIKLFFQAVILKRYSNP